MNRMDDAGRSGCGSITSFGLSGAFPEVELGRRSDYSLLSS